MKDLTNIAPEIFTTNLINNYMSNGKVVVFDPTSKKQTFVKHLKYFFPDKKDLNVVLLNKKQNNKSFVENLKSIGVLVYKNKKDKYEIIGINALLYKFNNNVKKNKLLIENNYDNSILQKVKNNKNIPIDNKPISILFSNGTLLKNKLTNQIFIVTSFTPSLSTIEIKPIFMSTTKYLKIIKNKKSATTRMIFTINSLFDKFEIVNLDVIGNLFE